MLRTTILTLCLSTIVAAAPTTSFADQASTEALLKKHGLVRRNTAYLLEDEAKIAVKMKELDTVSRSYTKANRAFVVEEKRVAAHEQNIAQWTQQRANVEVLLGQAQAAGNVALYNQLVNGFNQLGAQLEAAQRQRELLNKQLSKSRGGAHLLREDFIVKILEVRQMHDRIIGQYAKLSVDKEVKDALAELSKTANTTVKLGPLGRFKLTTRRLQRIQDSVISDRIQLRKGESDLLFVYTAFNERKPVEIAIDTGASLTVLPEKVADELSIVIPENAPIVMLQLADGKIIEAWQVNIDKVRVGKFECTNVECAIIPKKYPAAASALGQSYLKNFNYKINSDLALLTMTRISSEGAKKGR